MQSNAHGVLNVLSRDFMGLRHHVSGAMADLTRVQVALGGLASMTVGIGALTFMRRLEKHGEDLIHQQALLQTALGGTAAAHMQVAEATKAAWEATRTVRGTTVTGNMEAIRDLRGVFGDMHEAVALLPRFQRMAQVLADVGGKVGEAGGGQAYLAARMMELRGNMFTPDGKLNEERVQQLEQMTRVAVGTGGRVDPAQYLAFIQQARASGMNLSDESLFGTLPAVMMAMGGFRAGTGLQQAWKSTVTGRMTKQGHAIAAQYGLTSPEAAHTTGETATSTGLANYRTFATDPIQWVVGTLLPALKAHGVTDDIGTAKAINSIFTDRTAAGFVLELARGVIAAEKEGRNIAQVAPDPYASLQATDVMQREREFHSAWTNLLTALGSPLVEPAMGVMRAMTNAMESVTRFAVANPEAIRMIGIGLAGVAAALAVLGGVAIVAALAMFVPGGIGVVAFTAIAGGVAALALALKAETWQALWNAFLAPFRAAIDFFRITPEVAPRTPGQQLPGGSPYAAPELGGRPNPADPNAARRRALESDRQQYQRDNPRPAEPGTGRGYGPIAYRPDNDAPFVIQMDGREIARGLARRGDGNLTGRGTFDGRRGMGST